jgi:hypothetical protein
MIELRVVFVHHASFLLHRFFQGLSGQASDTVQSRVCETRQAGNGATVAFHRCAAVSPEPDQANLLSLIQP